jgi:hypothetical protein
MLLHLAVYLGVLALLAIIGAHLWAELPDNADIEPPAKAGWSLATRRYPACAASQFDLNGKTETYEVFRHPEGGRKDVLRWTAQGEKPVAELEIYRPGREAGGSESATAEIASRMDPEARQALETAGVIESKFGRVTLLRLAGEANGAALGDRGAKPKSARRVLERLRGSLRSGTSARCWFSCNFPRLVALL